MAAQRRTLNASSAAAVSGGGGGATVGRGGGVVVSMGGTPFYASKWATLMAAVFCLGSFSLLPILLLETTGTDSSSSAAAAIAGDTTGAGGGGDGGGHVSIHALIQQQENPLRKQEIIQAAAGGVTNGGGGGGAINGGVSAKTGTKSGPEVESLFEVMRVTKDGRRVPDLTLEDLISDEGFIDSNPNANNPQQLGPLARGVAGLPASQTPALDGAKRAHIEDCEINVDSVAYWNDPVGTRDQKFQSPFRVQQHDDKQEKYISFAADRGGWNNVRMSMEIIFVIAAVTQRTLVMPPREPLYLLGKDSANRYRGFADFFPITTAQFQSRVKTISFEEFLQKEGGSGGRLEVPADMKDKVANVADHCDHRAQSSTSCTIVFEYLEAVAYMPTMNAGKTCLVFDETKYQDTSAALPAPTQDHVDRICGKRQVEYWDAVLNQHDLIHFRAGTKEYRLLSHFYGMIHFTNPVHDHFYKRFVRDYLHYQHSIYCAAGKIVKAVQAEGLARGFVKDVEGAGAYSALHVRRGDLQYKRVKIPAAEWYENTKEVWLPNEILYVATDERNKTFFDDLAKHHDLRFLDDYWDFADLGSLDPNYMGMIDTIVASRGRAFAGTWFSTFTGYINRLRGYHGLSMQDSWYSFLPKKTAVHEWPFMDHFAYAFEWPDGWIEIDGDDWPTKEKF